MHFPPVPTHPAFMRVLRQFGSLLVLLALLLVGISAPAVAQSTPTGLTATAGSGQIVLSWSASDFPVAYPTYEHFYAAFYRVYRSTTPGGEGGHQIAEIDDPDPEDDDPPAPDTTYTDTNVTPGTTYYYTVTAVLETTGNGRPREGEDTGPQITESDMSDEVSATVAAGLAAPIGLTAAGGVGQVALSWTASAGAASYSLYRSITAGGEGTTPYKTGLTGTSYTDTGLTNGTTYYYKLTAVNASSESAPSNEASAATQTVTSITVSPSSASLQIGASRPFTATALDQLGNPLSPQPVITWTVDAGGVGSVSSTGWYAAGTVPGSATVHASSGSLSGTAAVSVTQLSRGSGLFPIDIYMPHTLCFEYPAIAKNGTSGPDEHGITSTTTESASLWRTTTPPPPNSPPTSAEAQGKDGLIVDTNSFGLGTTYYYKVVEHINVHYNLPQGYQGPPYYTDTTNDANMGTITLTPMQALATGNQAVDARYDPRYSTWTFINHNFSTTVFRGGLFAGYNADNSQVGHSYLKFQMLPVPSGQHLWNVGSVNAYYTRMYAPGSLTVGCQSVPASWDPATLTWSNAPAFSPTNAIAGQQTTVPLDPANSVPNWFHWVMAPDIAWALSNGGSYAAGFGAVNEPSTANGAPKVNSIGWAYFAKTEYQSGFAPCVLYAYGAPYP